MKNDDFMECQWDNTGEVGCIIIDNQTYPFLGVSENGRLSHQIYGYFDVINIKPGTLGVCPLNFQTHNAWHLEYQRARKENRLKHDPWNRCR